MSAKPFKPWKCDNCGCPESSTKKRNTWSVFVGGQISPLGFGVCEGATAKYDYSLCDTCTASPYAVLAMLQLASSMEVFLLMEQRPKAG